MLKHFKFEQFINDNLFILGYLYLYIFVIKRLLFNIIWQGLARYLSSWIILLCRQEIRSNYILNLPICIDVNLIIGSAIQAGIKVLCICKPWHCISLPLAKCDQISLHKSNLDSQRIGGQKAWTCQQKVIVASHWWPYWGTCMQNLRQPFLIKVKRALQTCGIVCKCWESIYFIGIRGNWVSG